jgi:GNAT superfamily N-acetyltransferase
VFEAIYRALEADSMAEIGPMLTRLLVIPLRDSSGRVSGGFWGCTNFGWLHIQMLVVPQPLRGQGIGRQRVGAAEAEARTRGCRGARVDRFSFQATGFYEKLGYACFGVLPDFPPGFSQHYLHKRLA